VARREDFAVSPAGGPARAWPRAAALAMAVLAAPAPAADPGEADVPYVPTPWVVVDAMLDLAAIGAQDYVVDLGSGDGRLVIAASKRYGARGLGVDIDASLVSAARREAQRQGVAGRVEFREDNLFVTDIARATVLTLYLYPRVMMQLRPRLLAELAPGTRIVSHEFDLQDWQPDARKTVPVPDKPYGPPRSDIYLWIVPANAAGHWRWRSGEGVDVELALAQRFQVLDGRPSIGGRPGRLEEGRMRGDRIAFILLTEAGGRAVRQEFSGRMSGDTITGTVRQEGSEAEWKAARVKSVTRFWER
jgi:SAM-dependent methyltransferase